VIAGPANRQRDIRALAELLGSLSGLEDSIQRAGGFRATDARALAAMAGAGTLTRRQLATLIGATPAHAASVVGRLRARGMVMDGERQGREKRLFLTGDGELQAGLVLSLYSNLLDCRTPRAIRLRALR
jgi:DNA-binding MarR family transcriptional regulator